MSWFRYSCRSSPRTRVPATRPITRGLGRPSNRIHTDVTQGPPSASHSRFRIGIANRICQRGLHLDFQYGLSIAIDELRESLRTATLTFPSCCREISLIPAPCACSLSLSDPPFVYLYIRHAIILLASPPTACFAGTTFYAHDCICSYHMVGLRASAAPFWQWCLMLI